MNEFHILSLSGGGYKGLFTAKVLAEIEDRFGCPVAQKFDLLSGTSIGGILSIALALEIPAKELVSIFSEKGKYIFTPNRTSFSGFLKSKYSNNGLQQVLFDLFGEKKIEDLRHRLIIPAINLTKGGPQVFKTPHNPRLYKDKSIKLVDVALATSAAPIYFPIHTTTFGDLVDGGLTANHPGLFACIEAQCFLDIKLSNIRQLHIGTLSNRFTSSGKNNFMKSGIFQWGTKLIELIFSCQEQTTHQIVKFMLADRYYSIDEKITDLQVRSIGLDKTHKTATKILLQCAEIAAQRCLVSDEFNYFSNHFKQSIKQDES